MAEIPDLGGKPICLVDLRGLIKVVPEHGARDKSFDYCINGFAIDHYSNLLMEHQNQHPDLCSTLIFVRTHQLVSANVAIDS